jgi:hypothetical protein
MSGHKETKRWLDPMDRSMEVLFGLIMVLTFTGSLSVWTAGRQDVREMLLGALGCNLAWGVIDGCFYLMGILAERGRHLKLARRLRTTTDTAAIAGMMKEVMPEGVVDVMSPTELLSLRDRITALPDDDRRTWLTGEDLLGALGVLLWVFLITFPVALPFVFVTDAVVALRVSNGIAIALLGLIGYTLAVYAGFRRWRTSLFMVLFGMAMVGLTIALGG